MRIETKFGLCDEVCLITDGRNKMWVDSITLCNGYVRYNCWDGNTTYNEYDEYQLKKYVPITSL